MAKDIIASNLEEVVDGWEYWCPNRSCRNRTFTIDTETSNKLLVPGSGDETKYLNVRVLVCSRCKTPMVLGTNIYYDRQSGWGARGAINTQAELQMLNRVTFEIGGGMSKHPIEYVAFIEPVPERPLPAKLNKKIVASFREAEYGVAKYKSISTAAAIRNTVRLLVEEHGISESNLNEAVKHLPFAPEYLAALGDMKIMGDDTLHYEHYEISQLLPAVETLHLALQDYYEHKERLALLHKAVGDKASAKGKEQKALKKKAPKES
ncbi:MAG: hypothetical protein UY35_C0005G0035 [Candidatus Saccharibacteria bacterium GW2011_GWC2_48_9]|nr:MAG: hypothetical protein UY35_C0005G0035 [Candidatus Saccharibacteria bacterium GW2011_GWC2_48_9]HCH34199.1 hypothetical protein [Candidatus Saccharibacteria bacterium]